MANNPDLKNLSGYISFIDKDKNIAWSHLHYADGETNYKVDAGIHSGCFMASLMEGQCFECPVDKTFSTKTLKEIEFESYGKLWLVTTFPDYTADGKFNGVFEIGNDITEIKRIKQQADEGQKQLSALVDNSLETIFILQHKRLVFLNAAGFRLFDIEPELMPTYDPLNFLPESGRKDYYKLFRSFVEGDFAEGPVEVEIVTPKGNSKWISVSSVKAIWKSNSALLCFAYEITRRRKTEEVLAARNADYQMLVEHQTDLVVRIDSEGRFLFASPSYCRLFGKSENELLGKKFMPLVHPDDHLSTEQAMEQLKRPPFSCKLEQRALTVQGWRWLEWSDDAILDENGTIMSVIGVGRDINDKKLAQLALVESERRLSELMSNLPGMAYRCKADRNWTMEFVSQGCIALTGYRPDDLIGNKKLSFDDIIQPEFREPLWDNWNECLRNKTQFTGEYQIITASGELKWVWEQGRGIYNSYNEVVALEGIILDINTRKQSEQDLFNSEKKYRSLVQSSLIGIYTTSLAGQILFANDALLQIMEFSSLEEVHKTGDDVTLIYKNPADRAEIIRLLKLDGYLKEKEIVWVTHHGNEKTVVLSALLTGETISGMVMDITDRKKNEVLLLEAKNRAEQSDRLKSAFLANVSHEIRTPLNGIIGYADMLAEPGNDIEARRHLAESIHTLSRQLTTTIDDILEISKIETKQVTVDYTYHNINTLLEKLYNEHNAEAQKKGIALLLGKGLQEAQAMVMVDGLHLNQVLNKLLSNALKFTRQGSVEFGCHLHGNDLEFFVKDTGIGISEAHLLVVFEQFRQVEESLTRDYRGLGIGLPITRSLIELMGGKLTVESKVNAGSAFRFTIPYRPSESASGKRVPANAKKPLEGLKILICEDDDFGYVYLNRVLANAGAGTQRAITGNQACRAIDSGDDIDLIIMDMRMPEMSGAEAAMRIRKVKPAIPIVCCSAFPADEIKRNSKSTAFTAIIQKPVNGPELISLIVKHMYPGE